MYVPSPHPTIQDIDNDILLTSINIIVLLFILSYSLYYMTCFRSIVQFYATNADESEKNNSDQQQQQQDKDEEEDEQQRQLLERGEEEQPSTQHYMTYEEDLMGEVAIIDVTIASPWVEVNRFQVLTCDMRWVYFYSWLFQRMIDNNPIPIH